jgi:hypothetical protein
MHPLFSAAQLESNFVAGHKNDTLLNSIHSFNFFLRRP